MCAEGSPGLALTFDQDNCSNSQQADRMSRVVVRHIFCLHCAPTLPKEKRAVLTPVWKAVQASDGIALALQTHLCRHSSLTRAIGLEALWAAQVFALKGDSTQRQQWIAFTSAKDVFV